MYCSEARWIGLSTNTSPVRSSAKEGLEGRLNEYGKDGWEVVTVWPQSLAENTARRLQVLLKRQVSLEEPTK